jgi:hypothetical protein
MSMNIPETIDVITLEEEHLSRSPDRVELVSSTIEVKKLRERFREFMSGLQAIIAEHTPDESPFQLNEIQFSAEITASGDFKLLGTGVGVQASSAVTFVLQRKSGEK